MLLISDYRIPKSPFARMDFFVCNKIGMVSYDEEIAIIIESQMIHNTQKSFFETMWEVSDKNIMPISN